MAKVVGVRFRNVGKIYYFNPKNYKVKPGDTSLVFWQITVAPFLITVNCSDRKSVV